jgi:hypothetical protein
MVDILGLLIAIASPICAGIFLGGFLWVVLGLFIGEFVWFTLSAIFGGFICENASIDKIMALFAGFGSTIGAMLFGKLFGSLGWILLGFFIVGPIGGGLLGFIAGTIGSWHARRIHEKHLSRNPLFKVWSSYDTPWEGEEKRPSQSD